MVEFEYEDLVKATEGFSRSRLIGKGSHGSVYGGKLTLKNDKQILVAVKKPLHAQYHYHRVNDNSKLDNEIRVLSSLPENPHVISFLGSTSTSHDSENPNRRLLVMEFMPNGSLYDLLHVAEKTPFWPQRVEIAIQIAKAVRFLHDRKPTVVHRDIKSENVLFDSNRVAKLADFGLAALVHVDSPGQPAGTIGYLDPLYTTPCKLSTKNDVFSYGVLLLEIMSGRKVIDVCRAPANIAEWAVPLIRERRVAEIYDPRVPLPAAHVAGTMRHLLCLAASCVSLEEACRPTMADVVSGMECRFLERVGFPIWMSLLRGMMLARKRRKLAKRWPEKCEDDHDDDHHASSTGNKMMLREVLANVAMK